MCELPSNFGELTKLTRLHLDENQLRALPDGFGGLVSLKLLDLCTHTFLNSRRRNDRERQLGLILLPDTDRNLDSKPNGYIVLYRNCSHCTDSDLDSDPYLDHRSLLYSFLGWISMRGSGSEPVSGNVNAPLRLITLPDSDTDSNSDWDVNQMAILYCVDVFILHRVGFRFYS